MNLSLTRSQIDLLFESYDINQNGLIDYSEFIASCLDTKAKDLEKYLLQIFREIDINKDGFLNTEELKEFFDCNAQFLKQRKIVGQIETLTKDPNYKLDYQEFLNYMKDEIFEETKSHVMTL